MSLKKIDANIASIAKLGPEFNTLVHETAVLILEHAKEHGDCSRAQVLVMTLPASFRRTTLIAWFTRFSPIVTKNDAKWNSKMQKPQTATGKDNPMFKPFDIPAAKALPFYELAEQNREVAAPTLLSFDDAVEQIRRIAERIERQLDDNLVKEDDFTSVVNLVQTIDKLDFKRVSNDSKANTANDSDGDAADQKERAA